MVVWTDTIIFTAFASYQIKRKNSLLLDLELHLLPIHNKMVSMVWYSILKWWHVLA